jgi:hypothetical protein
MIIVKIVIKYTVVITIIVDMLKDVGVITNAKTNVMDVYTLTVDIKDIVVVNKSVKICVIDVDI